MRLLTLDIETKPNVVLLFSLHGEQHIGLEQVIEFGGTICFGAMWHGTNKVMFHSDHHDGHEAMVRRAHELMSEADAIITYNGASFDVPHLNWEIEQLGLGPPAPHKNIDLYRTVRQSFRPASKKLAHVSDALGIGQKVKNAGMPLWKACMADDAKAWADMKRYCCQDVRLTDELYDRLLPWIKGHPNVTLTKQHTTIDTGDDGRPLDACPQCGLPGLVKRGLEYTAVSVYQRWYCDRRNGGCGKYSRSTHRENHSSRVGVA